jgi:hypothetical protein
VSWAGVHHQLWHAFRQVMVNSNCLSLIKSESIYSLCVQEGVGPMRVISMSQFTGSALGCRIGEVLVCPDLHCNARGQSARCSRPAPSGVCKRQRRQDARLYSINIHPNVCSSQPCSLQISHPFNHTTSSLTRKRHTNTLLPLVLFPQMAQAELKRQREQTGTEDCVRVLLWLETRTHLRTHWSNPNRVPLCFAESPHKAARSSVTWSCVPRFSF